MNFVQRNFFSHSALLFRKRTSKTMPKLSSKGFRADDKTKTAGRLYSEEIKHDSRSPNTDKDEEVEKVTTEEYGEYQRRRDLEKYGCLIYKRMSSAIQKLRSGRSVQDVQRFYGWSDYSMELVVKSLEYIRIAEEREKREREQYGRINSVSKNK